MADVLTEIRSEHTPTSSLEHCQYANPIACTSFIHRSANIHIEIGTSEIYLCKQKLEIISVDHLFQNVSVN